MWMMYDDDLMESVHILWMIESKVCHMTDMQCYLSCSDMDEALKAASELQQHPLSSIVSLYAAGI